MPTSKLGRQWSLEADRHNDLVLQALDGEQLKDCSEATLNLRTLAEASLIAEIESQEPSDNLYTRAGLLPLPGDHMAFYDVWTYGVRPSSLAIRIEDNIYRSRLNTLLKWEWQAKPINKALVKLALHSSVMNTGMFSGVNFWFMPAFTSISSPPGDTYLEAIVPFERDERIPLREDTIAECRELIASFFTQGTV